MADLSGMTPIRERVKTILRRDLKLGDIEIPDAMPFFNSESDLDSLDMLLLVTSVEREFGIKISSQDVGRAAFENVETLTRYISERSAAPLPPVVDYLGRLPHGEPFRFVSRVTSVREGETAEGMWAVTGSEAFFAGHFPGRPVVPGVLIVEALAQLSGLIAVVDVAVGDAHEGQLAHADVRFERPVIPPAEIILRSRLVRHLGQLRQFEVSAAIGEVIAAKGTLALHLSAAQVAPGENGSGPS